MHVDEYVRHRLESMGAEARVFRDGAAPCESPEQPPVFEVDFQEQWNRSGLAPADLDMCKVMKTCADAWKRHDKTTHKKLAVLCIDVSSSNALFYNSA